MLANRKISIAAVTACLVATASAPASAFFPNSEVTPEMTIPGCNVYLHPGGTAQCDSPFYMSINTADAVNPNRLIIAMQGLTMEGKIVSVTAVPSYKIDISWQVTGNRGPISVYCRQSPTHVCLTGFITLFNPPHQNTF